MIRPTELFIFVTIYNILYLFLDGFIVNGALITAENVCPVEEEVEEISLKKHEQTVVLHTTEACWDVTQGFRCKVKNNGTKITYKGMPLKKKQIIYKCCHGYFETPRETCEICPEGHYGNNCALRCNCSENEICDNVIGCCDLAKKQCHIVQSDALMEYAGNNNWLFFVLLASLFVIAVLLFGTIFYRKKYMKEKDPDLPTLTYHPDVKEFLPPDEIESCEFNNPLYRQSAIDAVPVKIMPDNSMPMAKSVLRRTSPGMNEYATLDYATATLADPPLSTATLLRYQSPYEVPLHLNTLDTRAAENKANERKESV